MKTKVLAISTLVAATWAPMALGIGATPGSPALRQEQDGRGYIGVGLAIDDRGMVVSEVYPGSPAAKIGLQVGDRLLRVGELDTKNAARVREVLAKRKPGDRIVVHVERDGWHRDLEITLATRASFDQEAQEREPRVQRDPRGRRTEARGVERDSETRRRIDALRQRGAELRESGARKKEPTGGGKADRRESVENFKVFTAERRAEGRRQVAIDRATEARKRVALERKVAAETRAVDKRDKAEAKRRAADRKADAKRQAADRKAKRQAAERKDVEAKHRAEDRRASRRVTDSEGAEIELLRAEVEGLRKELRKILDELRKLKKEYDRRGAR